MLKRDVKLAFNIAIINWFALVVLCLFGAIITQDLWPLSLTAMAMIPGVAFPMVYVLFVLVNRW